MARYGGQMKGRPPLGISTINGTRGGVSKQLDALDMSFFGGHMQGCHFFVISKINVCTFRQQYRYRFTATDLRCVVERRLEVLKWYNDL